MFNKLIHWSLNNRLLVIVGLVYRRQGRTGDGLELGTLAVSVPVAEEHA